MTDLLVGLAIGLVAGLLVGLLLHVQRSGALVASSRAAEARLADSQAAATAAVAQSRSVEDALGAARQEQARLQAEVGHLQRESAQRSLAEVEERTRLSGAFAQLSAEALRNNAEQFLTLADARLKTAEEEAKGELARRQQAISQVLLPLQVSLAKYEQGLRQLELERKGAYTGLTEQVKQIGATNEQLQRETRNLVTALRAPQTRGRWGEIQLRRVVEVAGMLQHCDFDEQVHTETDDGRLRPDLVVYLPDGAQVVVDAKVPLDAFLRAAEAEDDDVRKAELLAHARQLRAHVDQLAKKQYWSQFDPSPDFVVAFIPGDPLMSAAFENDPGLMEHAMENRVLLTTPTTLIALLRTVGYSWQKDQLTQNAREVQLLGAELYERLRVMGSHLSKLQRSLTGSVEAFNDAIGSLESRVLVTARRFPELGVVGSGAREIPEISPVVSTPRRTQAPELVGGVSDAVGSADQLLEVLPGGNQPTNESGAGQPSESDGYV